MAKAAGTAEFGGDLGESRFADAFDRYKQHLAWVGVAIILAGLGVWYYAHSRALREERAEAAYATAMQSVASGNKPLAESDLRKAATRYAGTNGGAESALALAKLYYLDGQWQQGIAVLSSAANEKTDIQPDARLLRAAGYEGLGEPAKAAQEYESAAGIARFDADKASAQAMAARAYEAGGNRAAAVKIWSELAKDPKSGFASEAKLRLGGLQATVVKS